MTRYVVDTGPLVGYLVADDQWHKWSERTLNAIDDVLHTSEAVVTETAWRLRRHADAVSRLLGWVTSGGLRVEPLIAGHAAELDLLLQKYPQMDVCDATVVRLSEILGPSKVITIDVRHFAVYRRHRSQAIPLICPS